ncbi:DUF2177 family protein [Pontivivens ytuae]|uniref:DUF2177 family protein n=1 Tax=Pontivivens ytuae TaxID=2789856 RepID=UPI001E408035|nr:DUF2177 family protein [Pontivivens ytuae]
MTDYLILYALTLAVFLIVDVVWLKLVVLDVFEARIGGMMRDQPLLGVAAAFYAAYVAGIVYLVSGPAMAADVSMGSVALQAAIIGLLAYGTYEFTNMSVMKGWDWTMVSMDTAWGGVLTAGSAVAGLALTRLLVN